MRALAILGLLAAPAEAAAAEAAAPKPPRDAPYCALPETRPLFIAPMGEPFRGARGAPWPSAAWATGADRNRDGAIDAGEFAADAQRFFRALDTNGDGRLTPDEIDAYETKIAPEIALYEAQRRAAPPDRRVLRSGESGYGGPLGAGEYAWLNVPEPVASTDGDMNRVIDATEFAAAAGRRFATLAGPAGRLRIADLPRTPLQVAIEGPCRPRPKLRRAERDERDERLRDMPSGERPAEDRPR